VTSVPADDLLIFIHTGICFAFVIPEETDNQVACREQFIHRYLA